MQLSCFPKLFRSWNAGFSCYNVMPLPEECCSTSLFTTGYKRLAEGGWEAFGGFWMWEDFGWERLFDGGFLAEGKLLKGGLLKGKELLKGNC
jgi:hypothetical protein